MRFLTGTEIQRHVKTIMSRSGNVMAAVAYWGTGAAERTGIARKRSPRKMRIICDLLSGSCNPEEIEKLMQRGIHVKTLDRLHAKVWIAGDDVILGSANASKNGLPDTDESTSNANVEAAIMSSDRSLSQEMQGWFETRWQAATAIDKELMDRAKTAWAHRKRFSGRAFTTTLMYKFWHPEPPDRFSGLRLVAYRVGDWSGQADQFLKTNAKFHYSDEDWADLKGEAPFYEWPRPCEEWTHPAGTVLMDFSCTKKGGPFNFNGFWKVRDCPIIRLKENSLTLLTKLPHFNGYSLSTEDEAGIAEAIKRFVSSRKFQTDDFEFYIDMDFLEFCRSESSMLKRRLVEQTVETARELCRNGQFDSALTLNTFRHCKRDPTWLSDYTTYVGGAIYEDRNPRKKEINREIGRRICAGVGGTNQTDGKKRAARVPVADEIIQSYTPLTGYSTSAVI